MFVSLLCSFAAVSYTLMFIKYVRSQRASNASNNSSIVDLFRRSRFYMAFILVLSTTILYVVPDMIYAFFSFEEHSFRAFILLRIYCIISIALSDTVDGVVYILSYRPVKKLLIKMLRRNTVANVQQDIRMATINQQPR